MKRFWHLILAVMFILLATHPVQAEEISRFAVDT